MADVTDSNDFMSKLEELLADAEDDEAEALAQASRARKQLEMAATALEMHLSKRAQEISNKRPHGITATLTVDRTGLGPHDHAYGFSWNRTQPRRAVHVIVNAETGTMGWRWSVGSARDGTSLHEGGSKAVSEATTDLLDRIILALGEQATFAAGQNPQVDMPPPFGS